ncbi:heavy-metal-associated domain-containing protein [Fibrivirga algicola]|uniref:Heavy-metal-associated domain-containing protein n=1 Tax=Fibrivirga algicola TaxID=2950420 RepID=A0ABX0QAZ7_9BACT|nr:MauE/DoxX family redox-associated membrane protein [Fibrivirga algicola]NID09455.1 heavy-metal-associated domain-containing protein [Fibrivirga algicola]
MIHTYKLDGMHCGSCVGRVQEALQDVEGVKKVAVSLQPQEAVVSMSRHIDTAVLDRAVRKAGAYSLTDEVQLIDTMGGHTAHQSQKIDVMTSPASQAATEELAEPSVTTYKPLLIILAFILGVTALVEVRVGTFDTMRAMSTFMAGFFLVFSFFKMLDIKGFASSYRMYDIVAKAIPGYGFVYPFIELALGAAYLTGFNPMVTNWVTLVVMSISLIGVVQSVLDKRKIRCACLGSVFNLPMTTVTIIEDSLMIGMAAVMLATL